MMLAIAGAAVMSGCGGTDTPTPGPTLNFLGGSEYVSSDVSLEVSSAFKVGIEASSDVKIDKLEISVSYNGGARVTPVGCTMCDSSINAKELSTEFNGTTNNVPGKEEWFFAVIDKDGNKTEKSITITTTAPPKDIQFVDVTLGNQNSASLGSSLSLTDATVYTLADAKTNSALVDVIYVTDDNDGEIMCAPSSTVAADKLSSASGPASWTTRNATKVRKTSLGSVQFDGMTNNSLLLNEVANNASASDEVKQVQSGDVLLFVPVSSTGKYCLAKVVSVTPADNSMTLKFAFEKD